MENLIYALAANRAELEGAREVKRRVFAAEQGISEELVFEGDDNPGNLDVVVKDGDRVVGTARVVLMDGGAAKLERMAVLRECRRLGVGRGIISFLSVELPSRGVSYVFLHAQQSAAGFYSSCGFEETGAPFYEAGIEHIMMEKRYN